MNFTDDKKVEKFNEILAEYGRLLSYRSNLANIIDKGGVDVVVEKKPGDNPGSYILESSSVKIPPEKTKAIITEIKSLDSVISFIESVVYGERITNNANLTEQEYENQHQHTQSSNRQEDLELSGND